MLFLKAYNEAVKKENLTYFSARQDNKFIIMTYKDGEYYGTVSDLPKDAKHKKSLCCFAIHLGMVMKLFLLQIL